MNEREDLLAIPFEDILTILVDSDDRLNHHHLYRLSDLAGEALTQFQETWPEIPAWRRRALLEELDQLYRSDFLLSFEAICRLALKDADYQTRYIAIRSLGAYKVTDLIPVFMDTLAGGEDDELRSLAAATLGQYVYLGEIDEIPRPKLTKIEDCLIQAAQNSQPDLVRQKAIESLGYSSRAEVPGLIEDAFQRQDTPWIASALAAMGRSYDKRWHPKVLQMLDHAVNDIRFEAVRAAGELEIGAAKSRLLELLDDEDGIIRMATVWSLSQIGGQGLDALFENMLDEIEDQAEAEQVEDALDNLIFNQSLGNLDDDIDLEF